MSARCGICGDTTRPLGDGTLVIHHLDDCPERPPVEGEGDGEGAHPVAAPSHPEPPRMSDEPEIRVLNPEAIGDPDQTPVVQLSPGMVAALKAAGIVCECGGMNGFHDEGCEALVSFYECPACRGHGFVYGATTTWINGVEMDNPCELCEGTGSVKPVTDLRKEQPK